MDVERVQAIASLSASLDDIPAVFIRPKQEQPGTTTFHGSAPQPPVINLANQNQTLVTNKIAKAAQEWGIFQVVNHGIPTKLIEELQTAGKKFFELPAEEKEKYASVPGSLEGYGTQLSKDQHGKKAWVDFLFHNIWPVSRINLNVWPKNPPNYRKSNEEYARHILRTSNEILKFLSLGLDLDEHVLQDALGGEELELLLKINYYPPCPRPDLALGVVAHTDMSAITILVPNDIPGLQVYKDDQWIDLDYTPGALIVHIGDQIEILSNGKYKGVLHRVAVNKDNLRMSWPVFCSPPGEKIVGPLPQLVDDENLAKYKAKKYKDYQYCKINKLPQ